MTKTSSELTESLRPRQTKWADTSPEGCWSLYPPTSTLRQSQPTF